MKWQILFLGKNKEKNIINLSSAVFAERVVKVKLFLAINPFNLADQRRCLCNSVDPDETTHNEPSRLDLHCLSF